MALLIVHNLTVVVTVKFLGKRTVQGVIAVPQR
jgi:hypothetical protein